MSSRVRIGVVAACGAVALAAHGAQFWPFIADDALISLRYAQHWVAGNGLVWNVGERVEGYSNLLWVALVALVHAFGVDPIMAARALGLTSSAAMVLAIASVPRVSISAGLAATGIAAALGPFAVWTFGGLEQPLGLALLAWSWKLLSEELLTRRRVFLASCLLALVTLNRPDGLLFAAVAGLVLLVDSSSLQTRERLLRTLTLWGGPAAAWLGQLCFRLLYYGDWIPNTARVKVAFTADRLVLGANYLWGGVPYFWPLLLMSTISAVVLVRDRTWRRLVLLTGSSALAWGVYVVIVGGDIFPAWRHFGPLLLAQVFLLAAALDRVSSLARPRRALVLSMVVASGIGLLILQLRAPENRRAIDERWEFDGQSIATALKAGFGARTSRPLFAVSAAGCLPYWSEFPSLDTLGLNDAWLAKHPPADFGHGPLAHELGNGGYVLGRAPDLVSWCGPFGSSSPCFRSERELAATPQFLQDYVLVRFIGNPPRHTESLIWVKRASDSVGVHSGPGGILTIPAYLLAGSSRARLTSPSAFGTDLAPGTRLEISGAVVRPGAWRISARGPRVEGLMLDRDGTHTALPVALTWAGGQPPVLVAGGPVILEELVFEPL